MRKTLFNLPNEVKFCKICVMSNQKPYSVVETKHSYERKNAKYMKFNSNGICSACQINKLSNKINWKSREKQLLRLLDKFRSGTKKFDCLVPGSGGKDSAMVAHLLKYKYGMNPLTCTWPPVFYTSYGYENFKNWLKEGKFENITIKPNQYLMRLLTKKSLMNLLHPFQTFIIGQKNIAPRLAAKLNIKLIFYGESESLYGNDRRSYFKATMDKKYFSKTTDNIILGGEKVSNILKDKKVKIEDLEYFFPIDQDEIIKKGIEYYYFGFYKKWNPQEVYYYASKYTGFKSRPFRSQGTYQKYSSLDDKIDDLHFYTQFIKFGYGRASVDASQEIRNKYLLRDEAVKLVEKYDGEFPDRYFNEIIKELKVNKDKFIKKCNTSRSPHLWKKYRNGWLLKKNVYGKPKYFNNL